MDPNRFLSTVQIGITFIGVGTGAFGGATLSGSVGSLLSGNPFIRDYSTQIAGIAVVVVITYLSLIIGELVPKCLALQVPDGMAYLVTPSMRLLSRATAPVVSFLVISSDFVFKLLSLKPSQDAVVSDEEIEQLLQQNTDAGVFHETERAMVSNILNITDRSASEMMTPRHRMIVIDLKADPDVAMELMATMPHSFYPVCDGSTDYVVGVVATRELWRRQLVDEPIDIHAGMGDCPERNASPDRRVLTLAARTQQRLDQCAQEAGLVHRATGLCRDVLAGIFGGRHHRAPAHPGRLDALSLDGTTIAQTITSRPLAQGLTCFACGFRQRPLTYLDVEAARWVGIPVERGQVFAGDVGQAWRRGILRRQGRCRDGPRNSQFRVVPSQAVVMLGTV